MHNLWSDAVMLLSELSRAASRAAIALTNPAGGAAAAKLTSTRGTASVAAMGIKHNTNARRRAGMAGNTKRHTLATRHARICRRVAATMGGPRPNSSAHTAGEQLHSCNCNGAPGYEMKRHAWICKHCGGFAVQLRHENPNLQHLQNSCNVAWFTPFPHTDCEWALAHGNGNKRKE